MLVTMTAFYCYQTVPFAGFNFNWPIRAQHLTVLAFFIGQQKM